MSGTGEEKTGFEIGLVVPKKDVQEGEHQGRCSDCVEVLVLELEKVGLIVERVVGVSDEFLKVGAPMAVLGRAAAELQIRKPTYIGLDLQFEWDEVDAFVRQPDGTLFSWCERFCCYMHLIYGIVNRAESVVNLDFDGRKIRWDIGQSLVEVLESENLVKEVFPLHDETKRKHLLKNWALNWMDFTQQPIDEIYSYFGMKIATYFAFLGMYTRWILFPAALGLTLQLIDFGLFRSWRSLMLPAFFTLLISWAVMFLQFWKRKNSAMLARWKTNHPAGVGMRCNPVNTEKNYLPSHAELAKKVEEDKLTEKEAYQRDEWLGHLLRFRNDAIFILSIICLQLPFELAYAHLYEIAGSDIIKFGLTAVYLLIIQYLTKIGGKVSVKLIKCEYNGNSESKADSLIYKVFGLYFMQTYIGLFYHALLHRNFMTLRQVLTQRMIVSQVLQNFVENCIPYLKYSFKKHRTVHKNKHQKGKLNGKVQVASRVEKEHLKPSYSASIGEELEDGLFDDFLELALQFGMIMMFACAFPLAFCFAALNNAVEIRTDALKLLAMLRRPVPRASATIGAWLNIFQFLLVMSICTNCALLVCLYDQERKWRLEPGLAAILVMEHALLFIKFGFSRFVPEEPAWVRASRLKNAEQAQYLCSRKFLRKASIEKEKWRENDE